MYISSGNKIYSLGGFRLDLPFCFLFVISKSTPPSVWSRWERKKWVTGRKTKSEIELCQGRGEGGVFRRPDDSTFDFTVKGTRKIVKGDVQVSKETMSGRSVDCVLLCTKNLV